MKSNLKASLIFILLLMLPSLVAAQVDSFGKIDTLFADIARIDSVNWTVTVSYDNDQKVVGLSIPLKLDAGLNKIVADSAIYTGGRVEHFAFKGFRPDTVIQCVTLGLVANLGPTKKTLPSGNGRLVTIFVSSLDNKPFKKLTVDTTTTSPNNSLMVIADRYQGGDKPDTIPIGDRKKLEIRPAFVVRQAKE